MQEIEDKVAALVRDIDRLSDADKRKAIVKFIEQVLLIERGTFLLDKHDLTNIHSDAVSQWHSVKPRQKIGGFELSSTDISAIMWTRGVLACLRRHKLLDKIVDFKFDVEYES